MEVSTLMLFQDPSSDFEKLVHDYFSDDPVYDDENFKRRFRMNRRLYIRIVADFEREFDFFKQMRKYLRKPTANDVHKLYVLHEQRHGLPGMLGSVDCTHGIGRIVPMHGGVNTIESPIFNNLFEGKAPDSSFDMNNTHYKHEYNLADGIIQSVTLSSKHLSGQQTSKGRSLKNVSARELNMHLLCIKKNGTLMILQHRSFCVEFGLIVGCRRKWRRSPAIACAAVVCNTDRQWPEISGGCCPVLAPVTAG
ncbi:hypothetical protein OSB04_012051 [Centaurea solstitialis]|uniref:Uncharacterized protein n=1 Tax=Centaurea solstitialis TaxID=347529 RepID=A0AA38WDL4_9ASTR|nr:hypothetical protein OSB04_012051 [Centaurea solstitialis]